MARTGKNELPKLLLVEDSETERAALAATARRLGFVVVTAPDAETACHSLHAQSPDIVLCDYEIPGGGFAVLERALDVASGMPFVLMTGVPGAGIRHEALRRGVSRFLRKPLTSARVRQAIDEALQGRVEGT